METPISPGCRIPILFMVSPCLRRQYSMPGRLKYRNENHHPHLWLTRRCPAVYSTFAGLDGQEDIWSNSPRHGDLSTLLKATEYSSFPWLENPRKLSRRFNDAGNNSMKMIGGMMDYVTGIAVDVLRSDGSILSGCRSDHPRLSACSRRIIRMSRECKDPWWGARLGFEQICRRTGLPRRKYMTFDADPARPLTPFLCAWSPSVIPALERLVACVP